MKSTIFLISALLIAGCDDGGGGDDTPDADRMRAEDASLGGAGGGGGEAGGGGEIGGAGGEIGGAGGELPDAGAPDMGRRRPVDNCEDACSVLEECDRLDLAGDSAEACAEACALASEGARFQGWLSCVELEACGRLDECPIPDPPAPGCSEVCEAIEGCGEDYRLPTGLPGLGDTCEATCAERVVEIRMGVCGEPLVREGICAERAFSRCMLEDRAPDCLRMCDAEAPCTDVEGFDPIDCALACAGAQASEDPVVQLRIDQRITCFDNLSSSCESLQGCINLQAQGAPDPEAVAAICAADEACGFFGEGCDAAVTEALGGLDAEAPACLEAAVGTCEDPLYGCFTSAPAPVNGCRSHCEVSALCGLLPEGQDTFTCQQLCDEALDSGDPEQAAAWAPLIECAGGATCPAIAACQSEADPAVTCAAHCEALSTCDALGGQTVEACAETCAAAFLTDRAQATRACVAAADACEDVSRCLPPPAPDCAPLCDLLTPCELGGANCQAACDDATFARPESYLERLACAAASDRCDARATCEGGDLARGRACLGWCQATTLCVDGEAGEAEMVACVQACGAGLPGVEGLTFAAAEPCLEAAEATCEATTACVDGADVTSLCDPYCAEMDRCRLAGEDAEGCVDACAEGLESGDQVEAVACTLGASRRQAGCGAVATCNGVEVDPASPDCQRLCGARNVCDPDFDAFLCERDCIPEPEGTDVRAACATQAECDEIDLCLAPEASIDPACVGACAEIGACAGLIGEGEGALFADEGACAVECAGAALLNGEGFPEALSNCARDVRMDTCSAEEIQACFDNPADICSDAYAAVESCGLQDVVGSEQMYIDQCRAEVAQDPAAGEARAQCFIDLANAAMGDQFTCLLGVFQCVLF